MNYTDGFNFSQEYKKLCGIRSGKRFTDFIINAKESFKRLDKLIDDFYVKSRECDYTNTKLLSQIDDIRFVLDDFITPFLIYMEGGIKNSEDKMPPVGRAGYDICAPTDVIVVDGEVVTKCFEYEDTIKVIIDSFRDRAGDYRRENKSIEIPIMVAAIKLCHVLEISIYESLNLLFLLIYIDF